MVGQDGVDSNDSYFVCHVPSIGENMNVSYFQVFFFLPAIRNTRVSYC